MTDTSFRTPRPVLFDLDGTLADTIPLLLASMRASYAHVGGTVPGEREWLRGMGMPLRSQFMHFESADVARVEALIAIYRAWQIEHLAEFVTEYDGIRLVLAALRKAGHPVAVVTSKGEFMARMTLEHVDLLSPFEVIVGADDTTRHKPDPDPLLLGAERLGVPAEGALYVGDAPNDVLAARAAGMIDVWAAWGPFPYSELEPFTPSHVVQTPMDLIPLIARLDADQHERAAEA
ncbi:MAG TPA: HAD-IA family hydrolase [Gemmatimonadaceae bacterium]|nr:HAD-IA family hydrolase [Gemmatimonadaceae bacterium]